MVSDEELDKFVSDTLQKDITQEDSIDPSVEQHIGEMGWLWDRVQHKLKDDNTCFECKGKILEEWEKDIKSHVVEAKHVEKGVIAFVSICNKCYEKAQKVKE